MLSLSKPNPLNTLSPIIYFDTEGHSICKSRMLQPLYTYSIVKGMTRLLRAACSAE